MHLWSLILIMLIHMQTVIVVRSCVRYFVMAHGLFKSRSYHTSLTRIRLSSLLSPCFIFFSFDHKDIRTYNQLGFIRSFQYGISCQRYHRCIDKSLHVKLMPLWRTYDTSPLKRANHEEDHVNLSRNFHDRIQRLRHCIGDHLLRDGRTIRRVANSFEPRLGCMP